MRIHIYHTNDIHSNFAFLSRVSAWLSANRGEEDFYFDSGDYCDLTSLVVQADGGRGALELLRGCGLDLMAVGNNEIDLGSERLEKIVDFPLLCANLTHNDGTPVPGLRDHKILQRGGIRFLITAAAPWYKWDMTPDHYNLFFEMGNLRTTEPVAALRRVLDAHAGEYDYAILLSHCGQLVDEAIRCRLPEIDLWLGGHNHAVVTQPDYSESGRGEYLGKITLELSDGKPRVVESVQILPEEADNPHFASALHAAEQRADAILSEELESAGELGFDPFCESPLTNFLCDCLHRHFGGDFALMHSGMSSRPLLRPVSRKSLIETFPSKLNPTVYRVRGKDILEALELSLDPEYIRCDGKGPGFRGTVLGTLGFSANVRITRSPLTMTVNAQPVEPERWYTIVADDYLQRGTGYPSLAVPEQEVVYDKWFIRDLVEHCLTDASLFQSAMISRMTESE